MRKRKLIKVPITVHGTPLYFVYVFPTEALKAYAFNLYLVPARMQWKINSTIFQHRMNSKYMALLILEQNLKVDTTFLNTFFATPSVRHSIIDTAKLCMGKDI